MAAVSNQQCNRCFAGRWSTYAVRDVGGTHVRYLKCKRCGAKDKQTQPIYLTKRRLGTNLSQAHIGAR